MITTAIIDGLDLTSDGYTVEAYELPPAKPNADARSDMRAGDLANPADYDDAAFSLTVIVRGDTAALCKTAVEALTRRFAPGVMLTWAEDGSSQLNTYIREVECADEEYHDLWARVVFVGTRDPFWHGPWYDLTPMSVPCWSSAYVSGVASAATVSGEVDAQLVLRATSPQATEWLGFGIKHDPSADYDPVDDYSSVASANCVGGEKSANLTLTATPTAIASAPSIDMESNRGNHLLAARVESSSAACSLKAASVAAAEVGAAVSADGSAITIPEAGKLRGVVLGRVRTPVVDMPGLEQGMGWAGGAIIAQTTGTAKVFPEFAGNVDAYQTFTLPADRRISSVSVKTDGSVYLLVAIYSVVGGVPDEEGGTAVYVGEGAAVGTGKVSTFACGIDLAAGEYAITILYTAASTSALWRNTNHTTFSGTAGHRNASGVWTPGDGTDSTIDLWFQIETQVAQVLGVSTPVKASAASGTAALDVVSRIPADDLAVIATRPAAADEGIVYDGSTDDVYVGNAAGKTGASLLGTSATVYGSHHGLRPGVNNLLVVAADTPYNASPSAIAFSGQYRERWIHLARP